MSNKIKKVVVLFLIALLVIPMANQTAVDAKDEDYSISSPETFIHETSVSDTERRQLLNDHWKFMYGEQSNAQLNTYDDSQWDDVQLPHDYSLDMAYSQSGEAESGYKLGGIGWYRKSFTLDESAKDKRVVVDFGGVYMNATVYMNGHKLGDHPNGYTPFAYDLTDYINDDGENVLAVRVNHKFPSSRWYSGSGIYRNVHLTITDDVHVDHYGVQVLTPNLEDQIGKDVDVEVNADIQNESAEDIQAVVKQSIREKGTEDHLVTGESDSLTIKANDSVSSNVSVKINDPKLWSLSDPNLYEVVTEVLVDDQVIDEYVTDYGFRTIEFHADTGFKLNGENVKLKGVSMHSDQGSLGAAAHERAMERQVEILLDMGVNAIRVTHNPAADELIEIANKKGVLIIDESFDTWVSSKNGNTHDYAVWFNEKVGDNPLLGATADMTWAEFDTKTMVRRGINAPSIISWSVGNEVMEGNNGPYDEYPEILEDLATWVSEIDQTRPATIGDNKLKANWGEAVSFGEKITELDGTIGFNYADGSHFDQYHEKYPDWKMYGAETASSINSRGVYKPSNYDRHLTSYDESAVGWGKFSADSWYEIITRDFMAGEFVWTGFDYLGEPTPWNNVGPGATGAWPSPKSSYFGIVDTAGLPKDRFYFYQSQWNDEVDTLHVLPAWKEDMVEIDDNGNVRVDVYSDARSVELFFKDVDGKEESLGKKEFTPYTTDAGHTYQVYEGEDKKDENFRNLYLTWDVPYEDGTVYAVGYDENDNVIESAEGRSNVTTFKEATDLKLEADRESIVADGRDLSYITIDVTDENGDIVEDAANLIHASVSGDGELMALDNGDQVDHEPYDSGKRKAFSGKLVAIVKSTTDAGEMTLNLESEGLKDQHITITTTPDPASSAEKHVIGYTMPKNYYVKLGYQPQLVSETKVRFSDGTEETHPITWDTEENMFEEPGTVNVVGVVEDYDLRVIANVTVIESVAALLNYSLATSTGVDGVNLPSSRPLVLEDGDVLGTEFPVEWEEQDAKDYEEPGLVNIHGTSTVFGETIPVTASVRVNDTELTLGENIASNNLTLTQDIPQQLRSDTLETIVDGDTGVEAVQEGEEPSVWTNYEMAQNGHNKAEIIFTYATAQYLGSADLYFYEDDLASRLPEDVELYWSNEGTEDANWTKIDNVTETFEETSEGTPNITKANYRFNGVPAVGFKIVVTSDPGTNEDDEKLAVALSEVELRVEHSSLNVNEEATLDNILLNGNSVSPSELKDKVINTEYQTATVETESDQNVAVTILEPYDDVIRVITESEDHLTRETYTIHLNQSAPEGDLPADDESLDYSYEKTTATAGDYHKNHDTEGDPNYAVDNDENTMFHTPWDGTDKSNFWITLEMEEVTDITSLRYLSRSGNSNGIVKDYKIEYSLDNETWEEAAVGQWSSENNTWSIAAFDEPIEAKYVRLTALSTYGDGGQADQFMTAKEIRLRVADEKESLENAEVILDQDVFSYDGEEKTPQATITIENKELEEGIDYRVSYENNVEAGEATIIMKGIANYAGTIEETFIILDKTALESLIKEAKDLSVEDYPAELSEALHEAIEAAEETLENAKTQEELADALSSLEEAIENLDKEPGTLDTKQLSDKIAEAQDLNLDIYTEDAVKALKEAIEVAEGVLENATTQEALDKALGDLEEVIDNLEREPGTIDTKPLSDKIAEAQDLNLEIYTEDAVKALTEAIEIAEEVLENATTQEELDEALADLEKVIENLEKEPVQLDKEALKAKLTEAEDLDVEGYTADSVKVLSEAMNAAEETLENATTQEEIEEALAQLEEAIGSLEKEPVKLDKEELNGKLTEAKDLDVKGYTADSVKFLSEAIKATEETLENARTQAELDEGLEVLKQAIRGLVEEEKPVEVDKSVLQKLLEESADKEADNYTEQSWSAFAKAINEGKDVLANEEATQEEVDTAVGSLNESIEKLVENAEKVVDKSKLEQAISKAEKENKEDYTTKSWKAFSKALTTAKKVFESESASQEEVDETVIDLDKAVNALQEKVNHNKGENDSNEQAGKDDPTGSEDGDNDNKLPSTATTIYNWISLGVLFIGLGLFVRFFVNRRRDVR